MENVVIERKLNVLYQMTVQNSGGVDTLECFSEHKSDGNYCNGCLDRQMCILANQFWACNGSEVENVQPDLQLKASTPDIIDSEKETPDEVDANAEFNTKAWELALMLLDGKPRDESLPYDIMDNKRKQWDSLNTDARGEAMKMYLIDIREKIRWAIGTGLDSVLKGTKE